MARFDNTHPQCKQFFNSRKQQKETQVGGPVDFRLKSERLEEKFTRSDGIKWIELNNIE